MLDPDALGGTFTHWLIYRMPPGITSLADVPPGAAEGVNDFGRRGYGGPCPPRGAAHHYHFVVLALDTWPGPGSRSEAVGSGLPHQRSRAGQGRTGRHLPARLSGPCQRQRARFGQQERGPSLSSDADHRVQSTSRWQARVTAVRAIHVSGATSVTERHESWSWFNSPTSDLPSTSRAPARSAIYKGGPLLGLTGDRVF